MLTIALSPYHITSREPAAMASLLLADSCVTLMPAPAPTPSRDDVRRTVERAPVYLDFMESWSWAAALFDEAVLTREHAGEDAATDVLDASRTIEHDDRYAPLRPLMKPGIFERADLTPGVVAADVLKRGPDPAVSVPVAAGIDTFAARHGLIVARAEAVSVVQKAEARLCTRLFAAAVPVLLQASAQRLLIARETLEPQLIDLRDAALDAVEAAIESAAESSTFTAAADAYTDAFEANAQLLTDPDLTDEDDDEVRPITGDITLSFLRMPADAALRSSAAAAHRAGLTKGAPPQAGASDQSQITLVIKALGRRAKTSAAR